MKITFITTNKHKFAEVADILKDYPIELEWLNTKYEEDHEDGIEITAKKAAKKLAEGLKKPVVLEDTGLFFEAYPGFPGSAPKFVFNTLGYKGILKLLEGESRKAYFETVAAYCEPGKEPVAFFGDLKGHLDTKIHDLHKDMMPYDHFFIPDGYKCMLGQLPISEKNAISQRGKAFRKFGDYITKNE